MIRSIPGITTAISLTLPMAAFGQTDARDTVRDVLDRYGYDVAHMERLTTSQVAEIYLTATSGDRGDLRTLLNAMDLSKDSSMAVEDFDPSANIDRVVTGELQTMGYTASQIDSLSDEEVAEIYLAITSEDNLAVRTAVEGALES
jgi:hypothetical protein